MNCPPVYYSHTSGPWLSVCCAVRASHCSWGFPYRHKLKMESDSIYLLFHPVQNFTSIDLNRSLKPSNTVVLNIFDSIDLVLVDQVLTSWPEFPNYIVCTWICIALTVHYRLLHTTMGWLCTVQCLHNSLPHSKISKDRVKMVNEKGWTIIRNILI